MGIKLAPTGVSVRCVRFECQEPQRCYSYGEMLGKRVRAARTRAGLSQTALAAQIRGRYDASMISNIERSRSLMRVEALTDMAAALNVSTDYLLGRTDNPKTVGRLGDHAQAFPVEDRQLAGALAVVAVHYEQLNAYGRKILLSDLRHHFPSMAWSEAPTIRPAATKTGS